MFEMSLVKFVVADFDVQKIVFLIFSVVSMRDITKSPVITLVMGGHRVAETLSH